MGTDPIAVHLGNLAAVERSVTTLPEPVANDHVERAEMLAEKDAAPGAKRRSWFGTSPDRSQSRASSKNNYRTGINGSVDVPPFRLGIAEIPARRLPGRGGDADMVKPDDCPTTQRFITHGRTIPTGGGRLCTIGQRARAPSSTWSLRPWTQRCERTRHDRDLGRPNRPRARDALM